MFSRSKPWGIAEPLANSPTRRILSKLFELPQSNTKFLTKTTKVSMLKRRPHSMLTISTVSTTNTESTAVQSDSNSESSDTECTRATTIEADAERFRCESPGIILEDTEDGSSETWGSDGESTEVEVESPIDWLTKCECGSTYSAGSPWGVAYGDVQVEEFVLDRDDRDVSLLITPGHESHPDSFHNNTSNSNVTPISPTQLFSLKFDDVFQKHNQAHKPSTSSQSVLQALPYTAYSTPQSKIDQLYQNSDSKQKPNFSQTGETGSRNTMQSFYHSQQSPICAPTYPIEPYIDDFKFPYMNDSLQSSMQFGAPPDSAQLKSLIEEAFLLAQQSQSCPNSPRLGPQRLSSSPHPSSDLSSSPSVRLQRHNSSPRPSRSVGASNPQSILSSFLAPPTSPSPMAGSLEYSYAQSDGAIPIPKSSSRSGSGICIATARNPTANYFPEIQGTPQLTPPTSLLTQQLSQVSSGTSSPNTRSPRHSRSNTVATTTTINALLNAAAAAAQAYQARTSRRRRRTHSRADSVSSVASEELDDEQDDEQKRDTLDSNSMFIDPTEVICAAATVANASSAITMAGGWPLTSANQSSMSGLYLSQFRALKDLRKGLQDLINVIENKGAPIQTFERGTTMEGAGIRESSEPPPIPRYVDCEMQTETKALAEIGVQTDKGEVQSELVGTDDSDLSETIDKGTPEEELQVVSEEVFVIEEDSVPDSPSYEDVEIIEEILYPATPPNSDYEPSELEAPTSDLETPMTEQLPPTHSIDSISVVGPTSIEEPSSPAISTETTEGTLVAAEPAIELPNNEEPNVAVKVVANETGLAVEIATTAESTASFSVQMTQILQPVQESAPDEFSLDESSQEDLYDAKGKALVPVTRHGLPSARAVASKFELKLSIDAGSAEGESSDLGSAVSIVSKFDTCELELESILRTPEKPKPNKRVSFSAEKIDQVMFFESDNSPSAIRESDQFFFIDLRDDERKSWRPQNYISMVNFKVPTKGAMTNAKPMKLESITIEDKTIMGSLLVKNLSFHKKVFLRYTTNEWQTHNDIVAQFKEAIKVPSMQGFEPALDRFTFNFELTSEFEKIMDGPYNEDGESVVLTPLSFVICYEVNNTAYWDNNNSKNFEAKLGRKRLPSNPKDLLANESARPAAKSKLPGKVNTPGKNSALPAADTNGRRSVNLRRHSSTLSEPLMKTNGWNDPSDDVPSQVAANSDPSFRFGRKYDFMNNVDRPSSETLSSLAEHSRRYADKIGINPPQQYPSYKSRSLYAQHGHVAGLTTMDEETLGSGAGGYGGVNQRGRYNAGSSSSGSSSAE